MSDQWTTENAESEAVEAAASRVEAELGEITVWVNNAFAGSLAFFWDTTPEEYERITRVTYLGQVNGTRAALARMRPRDRGVVVNVGSAIYEASVRLQEKLLRLAGHLLEANPADLELRDGRVFVRGMAQRSISFRELARAAVPGWASKLPPDLEPGLEATHYFVPPTVTWANAAHVAVVEVDTRTGTVELLDYVVAHDAGKLINPLLVEGQIRGGVAQGIGAALYEEIAYDRSGQMLSGSFVNYLLPGPMEVPRIKTVHLESPSPLNPLGVKGLGEGGAIAPPAAIANAVADALQPLSVPVSEIPLTPDRVLALLQQRDKVETGTV